MALPRPSIILVSASIALALAGCSSPAADTTSTPGVAAPIAPSADPASGSTVFEFQPNGVEPSRDVTVKFPADLLKAIGTEADTIFVESIRFTPHPLEGLKMCAVDVQINYADGGVAAMLKDPVLYGVDTATWDESAKADWEEKLATPDLHRVQNAFLLKTHALAEFDDVAPSVGLFLSDDFTSGVLVGRCALSAWDDDNAMSIHLSKASPPPTVGGTETFAAAGFAVVDVAVMVDGTIGVSGEINDYTRDANLNWIAN